MAIKYTLMVRWIALSFVLAVIPAMGQQSLGDPAAIRAGARLYGQRCGVCHGADARGGEAPGLTRSALVRSGPPKRLFDIIHNGIPGTEMPALGLAETEIWQVIAHLYSLARPGMGPPVAGDAEAGRRIFEQAGCANCHMIAGKGGFLGPDLSGIALRRFSRQIREAILDPAASVAFGFQPVRVKSGTRMIAGLLKNEDNFSIQILQADGEFALLPRGAMDTIAFEPATLMPADYGRKLSADDLQNLLAYLDRQRAPDTAEDIRPVAY